MAAKLRSRGKVVFTGGTSVNGRLSSFLADRIGRPVTVPSHPQYAGAIGAAVIAGERYKSDGGK